MLDSVSAHVNDHDAEGELTQVVLEFEASVDRDQRLELSLSECDEVPV